MQFFSSRKKRKNNILPIAMFVVIFVVILLSSLCAADCGLPVLPTDLDLITSVEATNHREVHLHGMYRIGLDTYDTFARGMVHNLTLLYTEPQEIRVSVLPHDAMTLDLALHVSGSADMVACSMRGGKGVERMVFAVLKPQVRYVLSIKYSMAWSWRENCPSVMMELATQPVSLAPKFKEVCYGAGKPPLPDIEPTSANNYYFEYVTPTESPSWIVTGNVDDQSSASTSKSSRDFAMIAQYPVTVPYVASRHQQWKFVAKLQSRFLDGGDVALMLTPASQKVMPNPNECANSSVLCVFGTRSLRNHFILQTVLWAGEEAGKDGAYTLWLIRRHAAEDFKRTCAPVSFDITLFPMKEAENFVTCAADPLPLTFNIPGLYDNLTGAMSFTQDVLVNLTARTQDARLQPTVSGTSLLRAYLGAHSTLDIDLILLSRAHDSREFLTVAASMAVSGPEGIVFELDDQHEYIIRVSVPYPFRQYDGSTDHDYYQFCDTYHLAVHVFPSIGDSASDTAACTERPPIFTELQEFLNATQRFEFGVPSLMTYTFTHKIDVSARMAQETIAEIRFFIPAGNLMLAAVVYSDAYGGTVQMQLLDEDDGTQNTPEPLYSRRRSVGTSITADLETGWYTLKLLTPYVQMGTKSYKEVFSEKSFPTCMRYNINLKIQPHSSCLNALQLPEEYPVTRHYHRHVADTYEIPIDGRHFMSIQPVKDSLLHLLLSASDTPVKVFLMKGDTSTMDFGADGSLDKSTSIITRGDDIFGNGPTTRPELIAKLSSGKSYTLVFDFTGGSNETGESFYCSTFDMQMSVSTIFPLSDGDANDCGVADEMPEEEDFGQVVLPFQYGPTVFALHPKGTDASNGKGQFHSWSYQFSIPRLSNVRVNFEYEFSHHGFGLLLCKCEKDSDECNKCIEAFGYYNGLEIPATEVAAGDYVLYVKPWEKGVASGSIGDDLYINFCTYATLQISVVASVNDVHPPPLCSPMLQFLPKTLNNVAFLSPYYNDETHFFLNLLLSSQHMEDLTTFTINERSIIRVASPAGSVLMSMALKGVDNAFRQATYRKDATIYAELAAGSYTLSLHYFLTREEWDPTSCQSIPIELSIMTVEDITAVASKTSFCENTLPFPLVPSHHGHDTLYRVPAQTLDKSIAFSIGELGGNVEFDVRYNFETSGLVVAFSGAETMSDGVAVSKVFPWVFFPDRAYLSASLQQGTYTLVIRDPVSLTGKYANATSAACVPYSLHLKTVDFGNYSSVTTAPKSSGNGTSTLFCNGYRTDEFPQTFLRTVGDDLFRFSSSLLDIPFSSGIETKVNVGQRQNTVRVTKRTIVVSAAVTTALRVWVRTMAKVLVRISLYDNTEVQDGGSGETVNAAPIATGTFFGFHAQSLYYPMWHLTHNADDGIDESKRSLRLEVEFFYNKEPMYRTDYQSCEEKKKLTTFELYASLFREDDAVSGTYCNATLQIMPREDRLPPQTISLGQSALSISRTFWMSNEDAQYNVKAHTKPPKPTRPPVNTNDPSYEPSYDGGASQRLLHELAVGDIPGVADELQSFVDIVFNTTITIPQGASGVTLVSHVKYPLDFMNFRSAIFLGAPTDLGQSDAISEGLGTPLAANDGMFQAESIIRQSLQPGQQYTIMFVEDNVLPFSRKQLYCLAFHWTLEVKALRYPSLTAAPPNAPTPPPIVAEKPHMIDYFPRHESQLDASDGLTLNFVFSEDIVMNIPRGSYFVVLQGDDSAAEVLPATQYFSDANQFTVLFLPFSLAWGTTYRLVIKDATMLKVAADNSPFEVKLIQQGSAITYSTALCGCSGGFCAAGGGCRCVERSGEQCGSCQSGYHLGAKAVSVGSGTFKTSQRVCEKDVASTTTTATPISSHTKAPGRATTRAPTTRAPTHHATSAPLGETTDVPASVTPVPQPAKRPPLHFLRYSLAYCAMIFLFGYSAMFFFRFRHRAQKTLLTKNPFRGIQYADGGGHSTADAEDDGDDDEDVRNEPSR